MRVGDVLAVVEALGVDAEQDFDAVPSPLGHARCGHASSQPERYRCVAQVEGRPARGEATWGGQGEGPGFGPDVADGGGGDGWPRSLLKIRPSGAVPKVAMWARRMATSSGGMGTGRVSSAARCFRPRSPGAAAAQRQYNQPRAGRTDPHHVAPTALLPGTVIRHPSATGPIAALLLVVATPPAPHRPGQATKAGTPAPGPNHDHSELQPPYQSQTVRSSVCTLSDCKFYFFFTAAVHFGDALIVVLP